VAELPHLAKVHEEFRDQGGLVLGIDYDALSTAPDEIGELVQRLEEFAETKGIGFPILVFNPAKGETITALEEFLGLEGGLPETVAMDATGKIVDHQGGPGDHKRFAEMMRKALGK
jgi:hypothetical protein